jgi:hypothetical protein
MMVKAEFFRLIFAWLFSQTDSGARSAWVSWVTTVFQSKPEASPDTDRSTPELLGIFFLSAAIALRGETPDGDGRRPGNFFTGFCRDQS